MNPTLYDPSTKLCLSSAFELASHTGGEVTALHLLAGFYAHPNRVSDFLSDYRILPAKIHGELTYTTRASKAVESEEVKAIFDIAERIAPTTSNRLVSESILFVALLKVPSKAVSLLRAHGVDPQVVLAAYEQKPVVATAPAKEEKMESRTIDSSPSAHQANVQQFAYTHAPKERRSLDTHELLGKLGVDLTAKAERGELDPVIGRDGEIQRTLQILTRRTKNNPLLIGEPGVGKSAVVEGLAQALVEDKVPANLSGKRVFSLDISSLLAGTRYRGDMEEKLKDALAAVKSMGDVILFIDEIHTIVSAGATDGGSLDVANILKPMLARGELQTVGATTLEEYRKYIEKDPALERRFQPIKVDAPSIEDSIAILEGLKSKYERFHGVSISPEAIKAAVTLSDRYIPDRHLPDKAIDLIDEAASRKRIDSGIGEEDNRLRKEIAALEKQAEQAGMRGEYGRLSEIRLERDQLVKQLAEVESARQVESHSVVVGFDDVAGVVSEWTGVPVTRLSAQESTKLLNLEEELHRYVIGQDNAVSTVAKAVRRARAGLKDPNRPIGTFLFMGPTGVGKTELSKALSRAVFGDENTIIRFDMSEYQDKSSISRLTGSAPGLVGYDEAGQLTEKVRRNPYSVVLFDEIEKAHSDVFNLFLQIMDDGRLTDSHGKTVSFKNCIIILTGNIGAGELNWDKGIGFGSGSSEDIKSKQLAALKRTMKPEFINRLDEVVIFEPLSRKDIGKIADILFVSLANRLNDKGITLKISHRAKDYLVDQGTSLEYGARPLKRAVRQYLEDPLSERLLTGEIEQGDTVWIDCDGRGLVFGKSSGQS